MERHVRAFNNGVRTGDWEPMLASFADDAELRFENVPAGPFHGIEAIRAAYREQPPDDEIALLGVMDDGEHTVTAAFRFTARYRVDGGAWVDLGPVPRTVTAAYDVVEVRSLLTR